MSCRCSCFGVRLENRRQLLLIVIYEQPGLLRVKDASIVSFVRNFFAILLSSKLDYNQVNPKGLSWSLHTSSIIYLHPAQPESVLMPPSSYSYVERRYLMWWLYLLLNMATWPSTQTNSNSIDGFKCGFRVLLFDLYSWCFSASRTMSPLISGCHTYVLYHMIHVLLCMFVCFFLSQLLSPQYSRPPFQ